MKKFRLFGYSLIILAICACAAACQPKQLDTPQYPLYQDIVDDEFPSRYLTVERFIKVENDYYSIDLPEGWTLENIDFGTIYDENNRPVGLIYSQTMYDNQIPIPGHGSEPLKYEWKSEKELGLCYMCDEADFTNDLEDEKQMILQAYGGLRDKGDPTFVSLCKAILSDHSVEYILDDKTIRRIAASLVIKK